MYREMPPDAMQPHDTWIIAFCPDTDSFFVTNQRAFYWELKDEFNEYMNRNYGATLYRITSLADKLKNKKYMDDALPFN